MTAHVFKMPEPICMAVDKLQRRFVLDTSVNSKFIKFTTQIMTKVSNSDFDLRDCYGTFSIRWSRTSLAMLLNKVHSSNLSKDKVKMVYAICLNSSRLVLVEDLIRSEVELKSRRRPTSVNDDFVSNAICTLQQNGGHTSNVSLNERMMFAQSIFHSVWTEVRKEEGLSSCFLFLIREKRVIDSPGGVILCITVGN